MKFARLLKLLKVNSWRFAMAADDRTTSAISKLSLRMIDSSGKSLKCNERVEMTFSHARYVAV